MELSPAKNTLSRNVTNVNPSPLYRSTSPSIPASSKAFLSSSYRESNSSSSIDPSSTWLGTSSVASGTLSMAICETSTAFGLKLFTTCTHFAWSTVEMEYRSTKKHSNSVTRSPYVSIQFAPPLADLFLFFIFSSCCLPHIRVPHSQIYPVSHLSLFRVSFSASAR